MEIFKLGDFMHKIRNLVFEGGGIHGIAYLGVLQYLYENNMMENVKRVAGTSAGAITACITSFNLPFLEVKNIADSLDFKKVPQKYDSKVIDIIPHEVKLYLDRIYGDYACVQRLIKNYGWFSSEYFYQWVKKQIENQFDKEKKAPPYTFEDFNNTSIHKDNRPFFDLYVIGTDISYKASKVFSYKTTPDMEVAEAVRISMSIPLFFEAITTDDSIEASAKVKSIYSDGGIMRNYPINIFDYPTINGKTIYRFNPQTLGARFKGHTKYKEVNNFLDFILNLFLCFSKIQQDSYNENTQDIDRSIDIATGEISSVNFNVTPGDESYTFLYSQGYKAAENYFMNK